MFRLLKEDAGNIIDIIHGSYFFSVLLCSRFSGRAFGRLRGDYYGCFGVVQGVRGAYQLDGTAGLVALRCAWNNTGYFNDSQSCCIPMLSSQVKKNNSVPG